MNLTIHSTMIELSFHRCNFVLEILDKEEPGARVWQKLMSKLQPKRSFFKKSVYLPASLHNFHTYSIIYFSDPIIKISWEKFGLSRLVEFLPQTFHAPRRPFKMEFLSIIHAINIPNCWHEALILHLVSENELLKPNQFHYLQLPRLLPCNCS